MLVVDASAIVALLFNEPEASRIAALIDGQRLATSSIFSFELANVCLMKSRRQPERRDAIRAAYALHPSLAIEEYPVDHAETLALAEATRLTHYDASYLWLARSLNAPLITLDKALLALTPPPAAR
ncbi:type II toxin-antitoxin system VapC family toxin [Sediminicoccus sp. KRV36]|uniref:type II toxin-antitoxin system VapC family toxin n=1 Tax=Sediminicoccus sp. KRV36 TaxID=3133721 RepID=UPI00200EC1A6|nr:type II toxin-antitoxin system VapC family toxin [Sediminicoccus rosea]UPY36005.1 type II toxin-antitoxin system VapC family toxin [Sediminicoccus rosea]